MSTEARELANEDSAALCYRALLEVCDAIVQHRDIESLLHHLAGRLHAVVIGSGSTNSIFRRNAESTETRGEP